MTAPTCRAVLTAPEAMPVRSGATLSSAAAVLGAMTRPWAHGAYACWLMRPA